MTESSFVTLFSFMLLFLLLAAIYALYSLFRPYKMKPSALPGFTETDRLSHLRSKLLFDSENKQIAMLSPRLSVVIPYSNLRGWSYEPRLHSNGNLAGWTFRIKTSDPHQPLVNIPFTAVRADTLEYWMAKMNAHVNG